MRFASFNIHHGAPASGPVDLAAVAAVIDGLVAEVVVLQEVDRRQRRSGRVDQAAALARMTGMRHRFVPALGGRCRWRSGYGIAVLSRSQLRDVEVVTLPHAATSEPRVAVVATVDDPSGSMPAITVAGTHLQARDVDEASMQLDVVLTAMARRSGPRLLLGDLNLDPDQVAAPFAAAGVIPVTTGPTFPSRHPVARIDWLAVAGMADAGLEVTEGEAVAAEVSDHRPIVAKISRITKM